MRFGVLVQAYRRPPVVLSVSSPVHNWAQLLWLHVSESMFWFLPRWKYSSPLSKFKLVLPHFCPQRLAHYVDLFFLQTSDRCQYMIMFAIKLYHRIPTTANPRSTQKTGILVHDQLGFLLMLKYVENYSTFPVSMDCLSFFALRFHGSVDEYYTAYPMRKLCGTWL